MRLSDAIIHLGVPRYADLMLGYDPHEPAVLLGPLIRLN
jgi:hypothetical protein